jgi:CRISPR system Cascade subunit CasE
MALHMLQMQPNVAAAMRWAGAQGLLAGKADDLGYVWHALLAAAFGPLAPKPFALVEHRHRPPALLGYGGHDAAALREQAALFALPDAAASLGVDGLASKAMPERFREGQRLGFSIRVRPVVRTDRGNDRSAVRERDAYLHAIDGRPAEAWPNRGTVYQEWLAAHLLRGGVTLEVLSLEAVRRADVLRRGRDRELRSSNGPDVTGLGVLQVNDPTLFAALLARGVGRHRAFGFGMLLLRPC